MIDLDAIKARLKAYRRGEYGYSRVPVNEGARWLMDIEALVAEVEQLQARYIVLRDQYTTLQYIADSLEIERDEARRWACRMMAERDEARRQLVSINRPTIEELIRADFLEGRP